MAVKQDVRNFVSIKGKKIISGVATYLVAYLDYTGLKVKWLPIWEVPFEKVHNFEEELKLFQKNARSRRKAIRNMKNYENTKKKRFSLPRPPTPPILIPLEATTELPDPRLRQQKKVQFSHEISQTNMMNLAM